MGAACSTSAFAKFKLLKDYFNSKPCLTFVSVRGFLPSGRLRGGPAIVVMGEDHGENESDNRRERCATVLHAMSKVVSTCPDEKIPTSRVLFFVEDKIASPEFLSPYARFSQRFKSKGYSKSNVFQPADDASGVERFSIHQVRQDVEDFSSMFQDGFVPVNFDIFYDFRVTYFPDSHLDYERLNPDLSMEEAISLVKIEIMKLHTCAGAIINDENVHKHVDNFTGLTQKTDEQMQTQFDQMKKTYEHYERDGSAENRKRMYTLVSVYVSRWILHFTIAFVNYKIKEDSKQSGVASRDLVGMKIMLSGYVKSTETFHMTTVCGDAIAYILFVKPRMSPIHANDVCVFYAGDFHARNISLWLEAASYVSKFERSSSSVL